MLDSIRRNKLRDIALSVSFLGWWAAVAAGAPGQAPVEPKVDFARDIRPILAQHCAACHGFDQKTRKAGLRLDLRESALAKKAIVPGSAKASKLIARIESDDETELMPPP